MNDPYGVARAIGVSVPLAILTFVAARKAFSGRSSRELERLKRAAGIDDGESAPRPLLLDLLPWALSVAVALTAFVSMIAIATGSKKFSTSDVPELQKGFIDGCSRSCVQGGAAAEACHSLCRCSWEELRKTHPRDDAFVEWFAADADLVRTEAAAATRLCLEHAQ